MKIRSGFVSNSSASSFLLYGVDNPDISAMAEYLNSIEPDTYSEEDEGDIIETFCKKFGLEYYNVDGEWTIGKSWSDVGDNQTGAEFKKTVQDALDLIGEEGQTCEAAWYG